MKNIYFFLVSFVALIGLSCSRQEQEVAMVFKGRIKLPLAENQYKTPFTIDQLPFYEKAPELVLFDYDAKSIAIYDWNTKRIKYHPSVMDVTPFQLFGFSNIKNNSYALTINNGINQWQHHQMTAVVDTSGKILRWYGLNSFPSQYPCEKDSTWSIVTNANIFTIKNNIFYSFKYYPYRIGEACFMEQQPPMGCHLDLNTGTYTLHEGAYIPSQTAYSYPFVYNVPHACMGHRANTILYTVGYSPEVLLYNYSSKKVESKVQIPSKHFDKVPSLGVHCKEEDCAMDSSIWPIYGQVAYDPYRYIYYRINRIPAAPNAKTLAEISVNRYEIVVIDTSFSVIGSTIVPDSLDPTAFFIASEGVYFYNKQASLADTNNMIFDVFYINALKNISENKNSNDMTSEYQPLYDHLALLQRPRGMNRGFRGKDDSFVG